MAYSALFFDFMISAVRFIILIGVLIFVHELGHFIAAKLCNVYVARFSLGFGKRLFGFRKGETEYRISAIPLGGYVKMVGQEDMPRTQEEAEQQEPELADVPPERRFDTQPFRNKLAISFAGPFMNLLFAFPVLWVMFMVGVQVPVSITQTYIGSVEEDSPAMKAGIKPGHRIVSINGEPVEQWEELQLKVWTHENEPLELALETMRGETIHTTVTPARREGSGRSTIGVEPLHMVAVGEVFPGRPAKEAGLKPGDVVLTYNHNAPAGETMNLKELIEAVYESPGKPVVLTVLRDGEILDIGVTPERVGAIRGVYFDERTVLQVDKKTAPDEAKALQPGDVVTAVNGQPLPDEGVEVALSRMISGEESRRVELTIKRRRGLLRAPEVFTVDVPLGEKGMIGVLFAPGKMEKFGPAKAFFKSFGEFGKATVLIFKTVYFLATNKLGVGEVAGPIGIAVITEQTLKVAGLAYYLKLVAIITINLGILNLLPIPVLDGGLIMISTIERIRRKPMKEEHLLLLQKIGFALILFLVLVATYNDILRVIKHLMGGEFLE